jgi:hypothetical protein
MNGEHLASGATLSRWFARHEFRNTFVEWITLTGILLALTLLGLAAAVWRMLGALGGLALWILTPVGRFLWKIPDELEDAFRCCKEADPPAVQLGDHATLVGHKQERQYRMMDPWEPYL